MAAHRAWAVVLVLLGVACKDPAERSVKACEDYVASQECGDYDLAASFTCDGYSTSECDMTDFFDCLADNTSCDPESGFDTNSAACAEFLCE